MRTILIRAEAPTRTITWCAEWYNRAWHVYEREYNIDTGTHEFTQPVYVASEGRFAGVGLAADVSWGYLMLGYRVTVETA